MYQIFEQFCCPLYSTEGCIQEPEQIARYGNTREYKGV